MKRTALIMGAIAFLGLPALAVAAPAEKSHHHKKVMHHDNTPSGEKSEHGDKGGNDKSSVGAGDKGGGSGGDKGGGAGSK